jgi:hypothetical protein
MTKMYEGKSQITIDVIIIDQLLWANAVIRKLNDLTIAELAF